ncbi:MAG: sigma-70 family RNA polymerase sigma factor [Planctomycetota bacterium]
MNPPEEHALLERVRRGDRSALGELLRAHERRIYHVCLRMVSHPDDAAELTQDVMVKVVQKIDDFRGDAKLSTWMTRIAMNLSISHLRKRRLRQTASLNTPAPGICPTVGRTSRKAGSISGGGGGGGERLADTREPGPAACVEQGEMLDQLQHAIAELDDDQRAVLVLRDIEQLDYQQIGETLDLPVGTVKSRLFRARLALRQKMNPTPLPEMPPEIPPKATPGSGP